MKKNFELWYRKSVCDFSEIDHEVMLDLLGTLLGVKIDRSIRGKGYDGVWYWQSKMSKVHSLNVEQLAKQGKCIAAHVTPDCIELYKHGEKFTLSFESFTQLALMLR